MLPTTPRVANNVIIFGAAQDAENIMSREEMEAETPALIEEMERCIGGKLQKLQMRGGDVLKDAGALRSLSDDLTKKGDKFKRDAGGMSAETLRADLVRSPPLARCHNWMLLFRVGARIEGEIVGNNG